MPADRRSFTEEEALAFHQSPQPGKVAVVATKPMATQRDLSLAYSPGVAAPVLRIAADPDLAYEYTSKGNMVAVISNGTAILGLGDLGALASKPVMEGKAVLFKRFADVDSIDLEVASRDPDEVITVVKNIGASFGGVNLEDIRSPDCFRIETELQELLDIPVFHDDQHGTAIITSAGLINACRITGREMGEVKVVLNGPGAAGIATLELIKAMGVRPENCLAVDRQGVLHRDRDDLDQWKSAHAADTPHRTLAEALVGADVFIGLSVKGALNAELVRAMAPAPIIFAMANPDPEITPEEVHSVRPDAIVATGRSDYPNQVNNVLGFPYIFRGALDVRARRVNHEMKIACAEALARLAREDVPDEVAAAYQGRSLRFGRDYIIPAPFDPRLIWYVPPFVAQAAMDTGVARKPIADMDGYRESLARRLDPTASLLQGVTSKVMGLKPKKRIVFAEGEETAVIRAAQAFQAQGLGRALLCGREETILENGRSVGIDVAQAGLEIVNARLSDSNAAYVDFLYARLQREGFLKRDAQRLINQDRNSFAASIVAMGDADGMVTGVTRTYNVSLRQVQRVIDPEPGGRVIGMTALLSRGRTLFVADTSVTEMPGSRDLVEIAVEAANAVKRLGYTPRVAFISYSTFGNPAGERGAKVREAVAMMDARSDIDFEYEGEMPPEVALDPEKRANYPFVRLTGDANVLVMPAIHSASISTKLAHLLGAATTVGPLLLGLSRPVQICNLSASVSQILNMATFAAYGLKVEP